MSRYLFDVHDDALAAWGNDPHECADRSAIESHVRLLLAEAYARQAACGTMTPSTTVSVLEETGGIVPTAIAKPDRDVRFVWTLG